MLKRLLYSFEKQKNVCEAAKSEVGVEKNDECTRNSLKYGKKHLKRDKKKTYLKLMSLSVNGNIWQGKERTV